VVFIDLTTGDRRSKFVRAMGAEGVPAAGPGGSVILPADARIEKKLTLHPAWPSFQTPQGRAIQYGRESCPRTLDIIGRFAGVRIDPHYTDEDVNDVIKAIRKVYTAMGPA